MSRNFPINLLANVQTVIGKQSYQFEEWLGKTENSRGYEVDSYAAAVTRHASIQPVSSKEVTLSGFSATSVYIKIYDIELIGILSRSENPDRIIYSGYYWKPSAPNDDWSIAGGWNKVYCVRQDKV